MAALNDSVMQSSSTSPQTVPYTGTAGSSTPVASNIVRLVSSSDCYWKASAAGTAATSSNGEFLPAGVVEYKKVNLGDIISAVQASAAGNLYVSQQV